MQVYVSEVVTTVGEAQCGLLRLEKCGAKIVVETDDRKYLNKRIEKWKKSHKCHTKCHKNSVSGGTP